MRRSRWLALATMAVAAATNPPLDVPFFRQQKNGCGAASVAMVMHYWAARGAVEPPEVPSAEQTYQRLYDERRKGILLADMRDYLHQHGFQAFTFRGRWSDIRQHLARGRPIIVALKPGRTRAMHFAVLVGLVDNDVWLNDPTKKKARRLTRTEFERHWELAEHWMLLASPS